MSLEQRGNSDIYVMDLRTRAVYAADRRSGDQHLALLSRPTAADRLRIRPRRLAAGLCDERRRLQCASHQFRGGKNGTPVWSPRGDLIAFTKQSGGSFHIGVMRPDGSGERIITDGWEDEGPTWAPNGRVLMFSRTLRGGRGSQIWSVDVTGRNERRVLDPGRCFRSGLVALDPVRSIFLRCRGFRDRFRRYR